MTWELYSLYATEGQAQEALRWFAKGGGDWRVIYGTHPRWPASPWRLERGRGLPS